MGFFPLLVVLLMIVLFFLMREALPLVSPDFQHQSNRLMIYDPHTGEQDSFKPKNPESYRRLYHDRKWYYNPWTGKKRKERDVTEDPKGEFIYVKKKWLSFN